jgi:hypothetical protein
MLACDIKSLFLTLALLVSGSYYAELCSESLLTATQLFL